MSNPQTHDYDVTLHCTLSVRQPSYSATHAKRSAQDRLRKILPGNWSLNVERSSTDSLPAAPVPGDEPEDPDEEPTSPWQEGDEGVIVKPGGGHGFPIGEPVRLDHAPDGPGKAYHWHSRRSGDRWAVPPECVKPESDFDHMGPSGKAVPKSTPAREAGWQVGDQGTVVDSDGSVLVEAGDRVELVEDDGTTLPFFRNLSRVTEYDSIALSLSRVRVDREDPLEEGPFEEATAETDPSDPTVWQVGDWFEVVDPQGNPFEAGEVVELIACDLDAQGRYARRGYVGHRYRSVHTGKTGVAKSHRLKRLEPHTITVDEMPGHGQGIADEMPGHGQGIAEASTPAGRAGWQVGDRGVVEEGFGHPWQVGERVELVRDDGTPIPKFRNVGTEDYQYTALSRIRRDRDSEAPTPAPGEVWDVVTPNLPPGEVSRLYVEALTDRVVTLMLTDWKPIPQRWGPRLGGGPMRYERSSVRFVERVQGTD